ncbi:MAG: alpha/beta hydrolase-fold protein [Hornefia sp.]|nr:alpha/beta hydrolase-fold protein [Hornefia sp.]
MGSRRNRQRHGENRSILKPGIMILVIVLGCFFLVNKFSADIGTKEEKQKAKTKTQREKIQGIKKLPGGYSSKAEKRGELREITYSVKPRLGGPQKVKSAMVYLPCGFDRDKKYNFFYLMHGYGGTHHTFLGSMMAPRTFKNVLDNMIENGDIPPAVVVSVTYTKDYEYYDSMNDLGTEVVEDLAPVVEKRYGSYAESTDRKGLVKSRAHRAIGGFSMGGCSTWMALKNNADCFKYYLPVSMPMYYDNGGYVDFRSRECAKQIASGANEKRGNKKVYIFAASGDEDFMNEATRRQAEDLAKYDGFKMSKGEFDEGNIIFHTWKGHKHSYRYSFPYFYNGLIRFWEQR